MRLFVTLFVLAGLAVLNWLFREVLGWAFAGGFGIGALYFFLLFRWHYGWWPDFDLDDEDDKNASLPRISR